MISPYQGVAELENKEQTDIVVTPVNDDIKEDVEGGHSLEDEFTEEEYNAVRRRIDFILMPLLMITFGIQFADKQSLSSAVIFGLKQDTGLSNQEYANLTTLFFVAFAAAQIPFSWVLQHFPIGKGLSVFVILWGACVMCLGACNNYAQLMVVRVLIAIFESVVIPGFAILTASWFLRKEQTFRQCLYYSMNQLFGMFAAIVIYALASHVQKHGGLAAWRVIQLFLGGLTVFVGIIDWFMIGTPSEVWWLSKREKKIAHARVAGNGTGGAEVAPWNWGHVKECFRDPQYYIALLFNFLVMIPNGGLLAFNQLIYVGFGFTPLESILYFMPAQTVAFFFVIGPGLCVQYWPNTRFPWAIFITALACASFLFCGLCPDSTDKWTRWGVFMFTLPFATALFMVWPLMSVNVAGRTKKSFFAGSSLVTYSAGNIVGSQIFKDPPRYLKGLTGVAVAMILYGILLVVWWVYCIKVNKKRDALCAAQGLTAEDAVIGNKIAGEQDLTDMENIHFRYSC